MYKKIGIVLIAIIGFTLTIFGTIYVLMQWQNNLINEQKQKFQKLDTTLLINGTIQEIRFDFDNCIYIVVNNTSYELTDMYKSSQYVNSKCLNFAKQLYYILHVNDTIKFYQSGRIEINEILYKEQHYTDVEGWVPYMVWLLLIPFFILWILIFVGIDYYNPTNYKKEYEKYKRKAEHRYTENKQLTTENKKLKARINVLSRDGHPVQPIALKAQYCHECGSKVKGTHCSYCGAEVRI